MVERLQPIILSSKSCNLVCQDIFKSIFQEINNLFLSDTYLEESLTKLSISGCYSDGTPYPYREGVPQKRCKELMDKSEIYFYYNNVYKPGYLSFPEMHEHGDVEFIIINYPEMIPNIDNFYHDVLHEMVHWTGHRTRLNRFLCIPEDDVENAIEEIITSLTTECLARVFCLVQDGTSNVIDVLLQIRRANLEIKNIWNFLPPVTDAVQYLLDIESKPLRTTPFTQKEKEWRNHLAKLSFSLQDRIALSKLETPLKLRVVT